MKLMKGTKVCIKTKSIQLQSRFHSMAGSLSTTAKQTIVQKRKSEAKHLSTENEKNLLLCALVSLETLNSIIFKFLFFRGRQINLLKFCSLTFSLSQSPPNLLQVLFFARLTAETLYNDMTLYKLNSCARFTIRLRICRSTTFAQFANFESNRNYFRICIPNQR